MIPEKVIPIKDNAVNTETNDRRLNFFLAFSFIFFASILVHSQSTNVTGATEKYYNLSLECLQCIQNLSDLVKVH